jgi:hypothetical protein
MFMTSKAQDPSVSKFDAPKKLPVSEKEFKKSEPDFLKAALWLRTTAVDTNSMSRIKMNAWTLAWISNCSYLTIEVNEPFLNLTDKNPHLMFVGLANYARYGLENNYANDKIKSWTMAVQAMVDCYQLGGQVVQDDDLDKAIDASKAGKLEALVAELMK